MKGEVFILTTEPPEKPGGTERFVGYVVQGLKERGYGVRVFHRENCVPPRWQNPSPDNKVAWFLAGLLQGYFIGKAAKQALHPDVRLVLSNSTVGWFPLGSRVRQAHFYHGTYRGQAEAIRPFISYRGYLKLKWWDAMVLERLSGRNKIVLCCSELIREEVRQFFGYRGHTVWYPIDLNHFRPLDRRACREELGLAATEPVGLFVGSAHPMKGFPTVEYLLRVFPKVQWLVAIRGKVPSQIQNFPGVRIFHNATYEVLPLVYNAADFSLCPSLYDPFPYVVSEALACATPVISSTNGAGLAFHKDTALKRLLITSADDRDGFERAVKLVLDDPIGWREVVQKQVRPRLTELMAPENWWRRFLSVIGLDDG